MLKYIQKSGCIRNLKGIRIWAVIGTGIDRETGFWREKFNFRQKFDFHHHNVPYYGVFAEIGYVIQFKANLPGALIAQTWVPPKNFELEYLTKMADSERTTRKAFKAGEKAVWSVFKPERWRWYYAAILIVELTKATAAIPGNWLIIAEMLMMT